MTGFKAIIDGIPSQVIREQKKYAEQREHAEQTLRLLKDSERVLDILRSIPAVPRKLDQNTIEKFMKIMAEARPAAFHDETESMLVGGAREYFAQRFPDQIKKYGSAFFGSEEFLNGRTVFIPESVNDLAFASIVGGDRSLGHQVVYYPAEAQWYFQDVRFDSAFVPTSEEKLGILLSHYFIECSQHCHPLSAKAVLKLRTPQTIKSVITTAKAMLEADGQFFSGKNGHRRYVDGRYIEANALPSYQLFVKRAIVRQPEGKVTVQDAFHRYYQFCKDNAMQPLTRSEFKDLVAEVIREQYNLGLRHDVLDERGKQTHGWLGLDCRLEDASPNGLN